MCRELKLVGTIALILVAAILLVVPSALGTDDLPWWIDVPLAIAALAAAIGLVSDLFGLIDRIRGWFGLNPEPPTTPTEIKMTLERDTAPDQMPDPQGPFVGREAEMSALMGAIQDGVAISGVLGQGGVGKTRLALELSDRLSQLGMFPDGHILVDMRGLDATPTTTAEARSQVIRALRGLDTPVPENPGELAGLYHATLREKCVLVLLDNARDADHVKPLLPPKPSVAVITSRTHIALPGLYPLGLDTLPATASVELLRRLAPRLTDSQAAELATLCGHLPLALELAASALAERLSLTAADYVRRMSTELERLPLAEAAFHTSYALLPPALAARWCVLGIFPADFDAPAAAAVWDVETEPAGRVLEELTRLSLVGWRDGRYRLHDLGRLYARQRACAPDAGVLEEAGLRHAAHFLEVLRAADALYLQGGAHIREGFALFDREWANILTGQAWAAARAEADEGAGRLTSDYGGTGVYCLDLRQTKQERISWLSAAVTASHQLGEKLAEGVHLGNLGLAYSDRGEPRKAIEQYEQALAIDREMGYRRGEGHNLGNLGVAHKNLGELRKAKDYYEEALAVDRETGNRRGEGDVLGNLGGIYWHLGEPRKAIGYLEQALTICRAVGDWHGEGIHLGNLGLAHATLGDTPKAIEYYERALAIDREIGDRHGEGNVHLNLGLALKSLGRVDEARAHFQAALKLFTALASPNAADAQAQLDVLK